MTKFELNEVATGAAYKNTEYTKEELQKLAVLIALQKVEEWQKAAEQNDDFEAYRHYEALKDAYRFMLDEVSE